MEIKELSFGGKFRIDYIGIMLRNKETQDIQVRCDVQVGNLPINFGQVNLHFTPDEETIEFLKNKIEIAISEGKIDSNMPYLKKK